MRRKREKLYRNSFLLALRGLFIITFGISTLAFPVFEGKLRIVGIFETFAIISGVLMIQAAISNRHHSYWQWLLMSGLLDFSFGLILWMIPKIDPLTIPLIFSFWFLYSGILQGVESFVLIHENVQNWWYELISGMLSFMMAFFIIALRLLPTSEILILLGVFACLYGVFVLVSTVILYEPD